MHFFTSVYVESAFHQRGLTPMIHLRLPLRQKRSKSFQKKCIPPQKITPRPLRRVFRHGENYSETFEIELNGDEEKVAALVVALYAAIGMQERGEGGGASSLGVDHAGAFKTGHETFTAEEEGFNAADL